MRKTDELLQKYWEGKTTRKEEKWLKENVNWGDEKNRDGEYFNYLRTKSEQRLGDVDFDSQILDKISDTQHNTKVFHFNNYWRVAAVVVLLIAAGIIWKQYSLESQTVEIASNNEVITDTYDDPEQAFEETKKALMFLSGKLNEGGAYTLEIKKFNESQEILKKE